LALRFRIWAQRAGVFVFVTFAWIFFRAGTINDGCLVVLRILTSGWADPRFPVLLLLPIALVWAWQLIEQRGDPARRLTLVSPVRIAIATFMIGYLVFVVPPGSQKFIYFNF